MNTVTTTWLPRLVPLLACIATLLGPAASGEDAPDRMLDLTRAVVVIPPTLSGPERKAVTLLVEDVGRRSGVTWQVATDWPGDKTAVVAVGPITAAAAFAGPYAKSLGDATRALKPEGFHIRTEP